jgi:hypothetical protein
LRVIIRHNFDVIHGNYQFTPAELVYLEQVPGGFIRADQAQSLLRSVGAAIPPEMAPEELPRPLRLFLSYSHKDEKHTDELRKDLKLMERSGLITVWYDRALSAGQKWEEAILQELRSADAIVCQLSRDFLASDFCVLTELKMAMERKQAGEAELIAYVLHDCGWTDVAELKQFQILPKDAKPLRAWKSKHEYWRAVADGIRVSLKKLQHKRTRGIARERF